GPTSLDRDEAERRRGNKQTQKPFRIEPLLIATATQVSPCSPERHQHHCYTARDHDLKRDVNNRDRRPHVCGKFVKAFHNRVRIVVREYAARVRHFDRVTCHTGGFVGNASDAKRCGLLSLKLSFERSEFYRLSFGDCLRDQVSAQRLQNRTHTANNERDVQCRFVKTIRAIAPEHEGVNACDRKPGCSISGEYHVKRLRKRRRVHHRGDRIDVDRFV